MTKPYYLLRNNFHFSSHEAEDMRYYMPGGLHPIIIGDILSPTDDKSESRRYRILHKLGFGAFATVWLAETTQPGKPYVAIKVTSADWDSTREVAMIKAISGTDSGQVPHIISLLDYFTIHGPNGSHSVLVMDVVAPIRGFSLSERPSLWRKAVALGLAKGVASLHSAGIVHGDLHLGNVGLAFPELDNQDPSDLMQDLSPHELTVVLPISSKDQTSSLPAYVIAPCIIATYYDTITCSTIPHTRIFDFGAAHEVGIAASKFHCATAVCAPEVAFARGVENIKDPPVDPPADIWALGCCIYELFSGSPLYGHVGMGGLPIDMARMAGFLPQRWQDWYAALPLHNPPEISQDASDSWWASKWKTIRPHCVDDGETDGLIAFLKKLLVLDPIARPTAVEVLRDPWLLHVDAMTKQVGISSTNVVDST